ncbi:MAG: LETM1-related biofilm-associated protein [Bacteroidota bacterium]
MNPSANAWVSKFYNEVDRIILSHQSNSAADFYENLKQVGFIYGANINAIFDFETPLKLTQIEFAKLNLLSALTLVYHQAYKDTNSLEKILAFYGEMQNTKSGLFHLPTLKKEAPEQLEKILHTRVQTNQSLLQKNFSHIVTNALLYVDILTFRKFLSGYKTPLQYAEKIEALLFNLVFLAIKEKSQTDRYDGLILKLLESSLRYKKQQQMLVLNKINFDFLSTENEKKYLLDLVCMTVYSDEVVDENEISFILILAEKIQLSKNYIDQSIQHIYSFVNTNRKSVAYFNYSNPLRHFYSRTQRNTLVLLKRNRKRLVNEIMESKELFLLLKASTKRELTLEEREKVKNQLYDIFKTIPSLTVFALPGGSVLLPIIIKFIPKILPSSFNENY